MVSIKKIATDIGVSAATVSNALTGKGRVSEEMTARIRSRAQELGYRPNNLARALKTGQTGILGLVMPDLTNPLFPRIAQMLSIAAERRGLGILIGDSRGSADEQNEVLKRLVDRGVDGLLVVPQKGTSPEMNAVPLAIINTASDPRNTVSADHAGGGALIARHISDIGHRNVVILGGDPVSEVQQDRISGMQSAMRQEIRSSVLWGDAGVAEVAERVRAGATAVLTTSDLLALRVHSELTRAQFSVPRRVSLTGFDNMSLASVMHPTLTTVAQDVEAIADRAIEILTAMIRGQAHPDTGRTLPMRLVVRNSTSNPEI
ncbi:LacI family DNA-binding transcriptional regulator [Hoeflea poritis]|uniref:LacI family DNA-binding transcriptional regulator n=1 Tax=Hoeflea poritis TaxID=2993659 RepID=A0ABT4VU34_9HYPH|nr:LacI family DNA-binding transcriptional regulator [Hoeflea poritis]MDA4847552.1 LacI family DNA-binding transcriptional regulator [Hoeflea poritis]